MTPNRRKREAEQAAEYGSKYYELGEFHAALDSCLRAIELCKGLRGSTEEFYAVELGRAGNALVELGEYDKAKFYIEKAMPLLKKERGPEHPDVATCYARLARIHREQGNYDKSRQFYEEALAIRKKVFGEEENEQSAHIINDLANVYLDQKNYDKAEVLALKALRILEKKPGKNHRSCSAPLNNLAVIFHAQGNYEKAKIYIDRANQLHNPSIFAINSAIINELARQEEEQRRKAEKLASLGRMATMMAHNINNPVGVIRAAVTGTLDDIHDNLFKPEELEPLLRTILEQVQRLDDIVTKFRQSARSDRNRQELIDLNALVRDMTAFFSGQFEHHHIELIVQPQEEDLPLLVQANPFELQEVLINLASNARDAVDGRSGAKVWIKTWATQEQVGFIVEDNGPGVPADLQKDLFSPFSSHKPDGTGLGLHTSYQAVQDMNGKLEYQPRHGGGACFKVTLPRREQTNGT